MAIRLGYDVSHSFGYFCGMHTLGPQWDQLQDSVYFNPTPSPNLHPYKSAGGIDTKAMHTYLRKWWEI